MTGTTKKLIHILAFACISFADMKALSQDSSSIHYDAGTRLFRLDGGGVTYAFGVNDAGELQPVYWGQALSLQDRLAAARRMPEAASFDSMATTTPKEFAGWGGGLYTEPALKVTFPDGNRDLVLHYVSHTINRDALTVTVKDEERAVVVELRYTIDPATGIVGRSAAIENKTAAPIMIEAAAAATWNLPRGTDYSLRYLTGRWAGEWRLEKQALLPGEVVLQSKRGSTGHQNNPWFAIERGEHQDEESGDVWFGALAWSGSWRITVEQDQLQQIRVTGGFNPFDFGYKLLPGKELETPVFYGGYSHAGIGEASRILHRFELTKILPQAPTPRPRPVIYNSWEATEFRVDMPGQSALADKAASIGVERFIMDDGWFGQRKDDHAGLGDWYVNKEKFPDGLKPLIDHVHSQGMDFGLWVEPEMVNPDSDLYRKHPEWVLNFPGRPRTEQRNQLVLNLARKDVRDYVYGFLDDLLAHNEIAFLKWDYNRNWSEPGWPAVAPDEQKEVYVEYTRNLFGILAELRKKYPNVEIESCSGGGGRVDLGILGYTDEVWPSDNTDPFDRLSIQDGFTYAYTPGVMMAWVTDSPSWANNRSTTVAYRFLSSMQGGLGVGANLNKWNDADFATAKELIAAYKGIRETVQHGSLYRLVSPRNGSEQSVTESVSTDKKQAALFAFLHSSTMGYPYPRVFLRGLDAKTTYKVTSIAGTLTKDSPTSASGAYWMSRGVDVELRGDLQAAAFRFDAQ
jgi:alpha-galactosidase